MIDCIGITGISLEAKSDPAWAEMLASDEATTAAQLATQELNGFPPWLKQLATARPGEVRQVFLGEVNDHLAVTPGQHGFIDKIAYADPALAALVAPSLIKHIEDHPDLSEAVLSKAMDLIGRALPVMQDLSNFGRLALGRFQTATSERIAALYLGSISGLIRTTPSRRSARSSMISTSLDRNASPNMLCRAFSVTGCFGQESIQRSYPSMSSKGS
jgi:hypothetical protein